MLDRRALRRSRRWQARRSTCDGRREAACQYADALPEKTGLAAKAAPAALQDNRAWQDHLYSPVADDLDCRPASHPAACCHAWFAIRSGARAESGPAPNRHPRSLICYAGCGATAFVRGSFRSARHSPAVSGDVNGTFDPTRRCGIGDRRCLAELAALMRTAHIIARECQSMPASLFMKAEPHHGPRRQRAAAHSHRARRRGVASKPRASEQRGGPSPLPMSSPTFLTLQPLAEIDFTWFMYRRRRRCCRTTHAQRPAAVAGRSRWCTSWPVAQTRHWAGRSPTQSPVTTPPTMHAVTRADR